VDVTQVDIPTDVATGPTSSYGRGRPLSSRPGNYTMVSADWPHPPRRRYETTAQDEGWFSPAVERWTRVPSTWPPKPLAGLGIYGPRADHEPRAGKSGADAAATPASARLIASRGYVTAGISRLHIPRHRPSPAQVGLSAFLGVVRPLGLLGSLRSQVPPFASLLPDPWRLGGSRTILRQALARARPAARNTAPHFSDAVQTGGLLPSSLSSLLCLDTKGVSDGAARCSPMLTTPAGRARDGSRRLQVGKANTMVSERYLRPGAYFSVRRETTHNRVEALLAVRRVGQ
jgi:hypothetical protein